MHAYPSALKSEEECYRALTHFTSSRDNIGLFYSDNAKELVKTVSSLGWRHELSKAYIHQSNAIAERAVRSSTEGTRTNLLQAGLSHVYWPHALEHACSMYNLVHPNGPKYTPWFKRFGVEFPGALLPFGCRVDYWLGPKSKRAKEGRERFAPTSEPGIFLGYHFQPGMKWKKEILVVPIKDVNRQDFNEFIKPIKVDRFEVPKGDYVFPLKERAEKVRLGGATDALERPVVESLTNQDAEEVEPGPTGSGEGEKFEPKVVDPKTGKMVPIPSGGMYYDAGGTLGRRYGGARGSRKPDNIPSYLWTAMSKKQKDQAVEEAAREAALEALEGERSSASKPSAPAAFNKDFWEVRGDKLVRYHCVPRREKFSPDLTDCPINVAHLSKARHTKIVPIGGTSLIMKMIGTISAIGIRSVPSNGLAKHSSTSERKVSMNPHQKSTLPCQLCQSLRLNPNTGKSYASAIR